MRKIYYVLLAMILAWQGEAQFATIGSGTSVTGGFNSSASDPIDGYYESFHYQVVYTAAELTAAGMPAGASINGLGWSVSTDYGGGNLIGYSIKIGNTAAANSSSHDASALTTVKSSFDYDPSVVAAGSFDMIAFDSDFVWDGTSNLLIDVCSAGPNAFTSPYGAVRTIASSTTDGSRYVREDGDGDYCGVDTESTNSTKPQVRFSYTFTATDPPECATNYSPFDSETAVPLNAILSWDGAPGTASYDVYFGAELPPVLVSSDQEGSTYDPGILMPNTTYYFRVYPKNNAGTMNCTVLTFHTGSDFNYCNPSYSNGCGSTGGDAIVSVELGSLSNASSCAASPYYTFYSGATVPDVAQGSSVSVMVTMGGDSSQYSGAWIDFNHNGVFEPSEGVVSTVDADENGTAELVFNVPVDASLGTTRMRVRGGDDNAMTADMACGASNSTWGEAEDYLVNITELPTDAPDYVNLQFPGSQTILAGSSFNVYGQAYEPGVTEAAGAAPGLQAWVGISPEGSDSNPNTWTTWIDASYNVQTGNNDEYVASIGADLPPGTYYYATRFRLNGGPFIYGGFPFNEWDGTTSVSGVLTVDPNPTQCATLTAPADAATAVANGTVTLMWDAPASGPAAESYDVYFGTTSGSLDFEGNTTDTSYDVTASAYSTTYYWMVVPQSFVGGEATGCAESSFTTEADPFTPYCSTVVFVENTEPITLVNFAGIDNATSATLNGTPDMENFTSIVGEVTTENTYTITLKGNSDGNFVNHWRVFIDWNQDGDLSDANEIYNAGTTSNTTGEDAVQTTLDITVPSDAIAGPTRMRVKKIWQTTNIDDPCAGTGYGQTEDYTLNITICTPVAWYADADSDGYGDASMMVMACVAPEGYVADNTDCDDTLAAVNPGAAEIAFNGVDDNCDGTIDEGSRIYSQVLPSQCGTTLASISSLIGAVSYGGPVDGYRFRVVNTATLDEETLDRTAPHFQLTQMASYDYASTYEISVMLRRNGVWLNYYGPGCQISTPAVLDPGGSAAVNPSQCGITLSSLSTLIATTSLPGVTGYRFRVTDMVTNAEQTIDRTHNWFSLTMLGEYLYGRSYNIEVAVKTNGDYSGYGQPCSVTTPAVPMLANCGQIVASNSTLIATTSLNRVTSYRFQLTNMNDFSTVMVDRSVNYFSFHNVPGYEAGAPYSVSVAVMTAGNWSEFGEACTITSPAAAKAAVKGDGELQPRIDFRAVVYPNPYTESYALDMDTAGDAPIKVRVYDMIGKLVEEREFAPDAIEMQQFGERYPSGVYNVVVSQQGFVKTLRVIKR